MASAIDLDASVPDQRTWSNLELMEEITQILPFLVEGLKSDKPVNKVSAGSFTAEKPSVTTFPNENTRPVIVTYGDR